MMGKPSTGASIISICGNIIIEYWMKMMMVIFHRRHGNDDDSDTVVGKNIDMITATTMT